MRAHSKIAAWVLALCVVFAATFAPQVAMAQDDSIDQAIELSKSAMEDYDFFELEAADSKLMQATAIVETLNDTSPKAANIYIAQGVVSYGRFKDSAKAIAEERAFSAFLKALSIDASASIPKDYRSTELEAILDKARAAIATAPKTSVVPTAKPAIDHTPVPTHDRCTAFEIAANVPAHPDIYRVKLYYAVDDKRGYESLEMRPVADHPDRLVAVIPGLDTQGERIRYFIEATNRTGEPVVNVGSDLRPLNTALTGECRGFSDDDIESQYGSPLFQLSVMIGTGAAVVDGETYTLPLDAIKNSAGGAGDEKRYSGVNTGLAVVPLHLRASAVFNLPANFQLGAYIRGQLVNIVDKGLRYDKNSNLAVEISDGKVVGNLMVGVVLRYLAISRQPYRMYVGLEFGWGGANATVDLGADFNNYKAIYLIKGPFHIAPEIGFLWSFHRNVGLAVELAVPFHFPDKFTPQFDLSVGPYFQF